MGHTLYCWRILTNYNQVIIYTMTFIAYTQNIDNITLRSSMTKDPPFGRKSQGGEVG